MNILVIGGGGREHALCYKLAESPRVTCIFCAPGNGGTAVEKKTENVPIEVTNICALIKFAQKHLIDLVIVGSDDALASGVVDAFQGVGIKVFGPTEQAAKIESSKAFAKALMQGGGIPTAKSKTFTNFEKALSYATTNLPCFIKADGLALGKGAVGCKTEAEVAITLNAMMVEKKFGDAGKTVVIEEWLEGEEFSIHAFCDSSHSILCPFVKDHKRAKDGDLGENTGGMGAVGPIDKGYAKEAVAKTFFVDSVLEAMENLCPFRGLLFPGIMDTKDGMKVLEFNARFGDPETQVLLTLLESPLLDLIEATVDNRLQEIEAKVQWRRGFAVCVVITSGGYPQTFMHGFPIKGIENAEEIPGVKVFHAGTKRVDSKLTTSGGRVLGVTAFDESLDGAIEKAYRAVEHIHFSHMQFRQDIGRSLLLTK